MIATLPMYDWPELRSATDAWWSGLARALRRQGVPEVPERLSRAGRFPDSWTQPDLLLSQTCGFPLVETFSACLAPLGAPVYSAEGCQGATYRSVIIARESKALDDFRGATAAINSRDSLSGCLALAAVFSPVAAGKETFFDQVIETGGHAESCAAVAAGRASVAAIDCVSFAIAKVHRPALVANLSIVGMSPRAPSLPYVTAARHSRELQRRIREALGQAFEDRDLTETRQALLLESMAPIDRADYEEAVKALKKAANTLLQVFV